MARRPKIIGKLRDSDGKEYPVEMLTASQTRVVFRPYNAEVGNLAVNWNHLQHNLSALFQLLLRSADGYAGKAIWHSADSDFVQRKMLRALIELDEKVMDPSRQKTLEPHHRREILWILNQIDESLRHKRNNAIHAPLMIVRGVYGGEVRAWAEAILDPQNPKAKALRGKDLIEEFRDYTALAEVLAAYSARVWRALDAPASHPWPKRPLLPQAHKRKRRARRDKHRPPPHLL